MQTIIKVKGIEKSFVDLKVFENVHFEIKLGERIGFVGFNGTGKTTLANILFGKISPDQGIIEKAKDCKIGYLNQSVDYEFSEFHESLNGNDSLLKYASQLGLEKIYEWKEERLRQLSGGEKLKLALSLVWASKPDFLILDEPTNHLDYKGIEWLISELKNFQGPVLIISHDRHFLDRTVNRIFELENRHIHFYNGNYSDYREEKKKRVEDQLHQYNVQKRYKDKIEKQMEQLKNWSEKAHRDSTKGSTTKSRDFGYKEYHRVKAKKRDIQVRSKMKRLLSELEKNKVEKPTEEAKVQFQFDSHGKRGKRVIEAKKLTKTFAGRTLFRDSQFYINHGERIGLIGENGCGKTTLLKLFVGEENQSAGELWRSESVKIAYLTQDVSDLPEDKNSIEALGLTEQKDIFRARTMLANLGLMETVILKPIGTLSLGERTRVKLVDMLMKEYDVLILDEPTNHFDLPSREQLENTLSEFKGTIIMVSHDYYFLNMLCDRLLIFEHPFIKRVDMKLEAYLNRGKTINSRDEDLMIIENKLASILGELSLIDKNDPNYFLLDQEFNELLKKKRDFIN